MREGSSRGEMTVREAGQKGGKIGGKTTSQRYGRGFYHEIGLKGGHKTRELVEAGKRASGRSSQSRMEE